LDPNEAGNRTALSYDVDPGATITDSVTLYNYGNTQLTFRIYATDAFNNEDGQFDLIPGAEEPTDVGSWVTMPQANITVPPGRQVVLPITLDVPANATAGDHVGAILAANDAEGTGPDGTALDLTNGVACGPTGRVLGLPGVWAVGDAARWDGHRTEHWTSAGDQAAVVAHDVLGAEPPPPTVPYFWSDQFGLKIQLIGRPDRADAVEPLLGTGLTGGPVRGTVVGYLAGDALVAVAGFGAARYVARYRALVADGADRAAARELAATFG